ncbi:MAG: hypothetical protein Q4B81_04180 [Moraxella sp.]|nr:hypothetical protein [Moraxella sp.]
MTIKDDMLEQEMLEKDICFVCHEQNDTCECNNPLTYAQAKNTDNPTWIRITCVDDMPIDEGFVLLKHKNDDILVGQHAFDTNPFTATTEFYQSQDYEWLADLSDIVAWCKIPEESTNDTDH